MPVTSVFSMMGCKLDNIVEEVMELVGDPLITVSNAGVTDTVFLSLLFEFVLVFSLASLILFYFCFHTYRFLLFLTLLFS